MKTDIQIKEKPKCEACNNPAFGYVRNVLLCGMCMVKWQEKERKRFKALVLEELRT